jgi:hypothetical protein
MATIFSDNFNSYNDGNLFSQGGWTQVGGNLTVGATYAYEGAKGAGSVGNTFDDYGYKDGTGLTTGQITHYFKIGGNNCRWYFYLEDSSNTAIIDFTAWIANGYCKLLGNNVGNFTTDVWHSVTIQWTTTQARVSIDGGTYSSYYNRTAGDVSRVYVEAYAPAGGSANYLYFDYIAENLADITINLPLGTITLGGQVPTTTGNAVINMVLGTITLLGNLPAFLLKGWKNQVKHSAGTITNATKHTITPTNQAKHSASNIINKTKSL